LTIFLWLGGTSVQKDEGNAYEQSTDDDAEEEKEKEGSPVKQESPSEQDTEDELEK
jgi:hypothetical protein